MSIKILYRGKLPEETMYEGTCINCGTKIAAARDDHAGTYTPARIIEVKCPLDGCNHLIKCRQQKL